MTQAIPGRGTSTNPPNRFERLNYEVPEPEDDGEPNRPKTVFYRDRSRTIIAHNDSPDVGFSASINPYRGCEHGCAYCYARPYHEYLGLSSGIDFETKTFIKEDAPELLRAELASKRWQPQTLGISGITDAYQPIERHVEITRRCLQVCLDLRNPVVIVTKNQLVARDIDVLKELTRYQAAAVFVSVTTLDASLTRKLEPRASQPEGRLAAIRALSEAGIPTGILAAPVIPGLTDHELPAIVQATAAAGARWAGFVMLRLPFAVKDIFAQWLDTHFPEKKERVLGRLRDMHGGKINDNRFGYRMTGEGPVADAIRTMFQLARKRAGMSRERIELSTASFRRLQEQPWLPFGE
ncbi:MAG TPA: PA0069 family radical SAM protein [Gemmataceae bacterium]|jgi:DNA repair photolyase|nr:PA0069 family radical SAM protein [Gemmataceae bacterium]